MAIRETQPSVSGPFRTCLHECQRRKEHHHVAPIGEEVPGNHLNHLAAPEREHERRANGTYRISLSAGSQRGAEHCARFNQRKAASPIMPASNVKLRKPLSAMRGLPKRWVWGSVL